MGFEPLDADGLQALLDLRQWTPGPVGFKPLGANGLQVLQDLSHWPLGLRASGPVTVNVQRNPDSKLEKPTAKLVREKPSMRDGRARAYDWVSRVGVN